MNKISKFLLCENPIVNDSRIFILHTGTPLILAEAFHFDFDTDEKIVMNCKRQFTAGASVDYPLEYIVLGAIFVEPNNKSVDELAKIMSRMGDWYHAYLKWEDNNIKKIYE